MITAAVVLLGAAALCFAIRLIIGPRLSDRVMGLDGLVIVGVSAVALRAMSSGDGSFLPVLVVVTLVGFVGTSASARFIEGLSDRDPVMPDDAEDATAPEHVDPDDDGARPLADRDDPEASK